MFMAASLQQGQALICPDPQKKPKILLKNVHPHAKPGQ
jgi:hypothetical protein